MYIYIYIAGIHMNRNWAKHKWFQSYLFFLYRIDNMIPKAHACTACWPFILNGWSTRRAWVWELKVPDDDGYAVTHPSDDCHKYDSVWASDWMDTRVKKTPDAVTHIYNQHIYLGKLEVMNKTHKLLDIPAVRAGGGAFATLIAGAIFQFPSACGHIWFKTDSIYTALQIEARKTPGVWFQRKHDLLAKLGQDYLLGYPPSHTINESLKWIQHIYTKLQDNIFHHKHHL